MQEVYIVPLRRIQTSDLAVLSTDQIERVFSNVEALVRERLPSCDRTHSSGQIKVNKGLLDALQTAKATQGSIGSVFLEHDDQLRR